MSTVSGKTVVLLLAAILSVPAIFMILAIAWAFWPGR
jgi:hypothetical protein